MTTKGKVNKRFVRPRNPDIPVSDFPNGNVIYSQNDVEDVRQVVHDAAKSRYEDSLNPDTYVISHNNQRIKRRRETDDSEGWTSISGDKMTKENFVHNNMVHFYSGTEPKMYNVDHTINNSLLDLYTGEDRKPKEEVEPFFNQEPNTTSALGDPNIKRDMSYFVPSGYRQNEAPIDPVRVPPMFKMGTSRVLPKTTDQLRGSSNPKVSFEG